MEPAARPRFSVVIVPVVTSGENSAPTTITGPTRPTRPPRASTPVTAATSHRRLTTSTRPSL